jgi:uncharacterized protein (DUF2461 family)
MCAFIDSMAPRLCKTSPHFIADSRTHGDSMFRIYRDVRFYVHISTEEAAGYRDRSLIFNPGIKIKDLTPSLRACR